jgi:epimerase EvaD
MFPRFGWSDVQIRNLSVAGSVEFTPVRYGDDRGSFRSPLLESSMVEATGHPLFPVAQASCSVSRRGVVRGVHYALTPPGTAQYVYCPQGRALDFVVDLRVGSPSFGRWESTILEPVTSRAVYLPVGVGHLFIALADDTVMSYLMSQEYVAAHELAILPTDPQLGLPLPVDATVSERDLVAPTLAQALAQQLLPDYELCTELEARF